MVGKAVRIEPVRPSEAPAVAASPHPLHGRSASTPGRGPAVPAPTPTGLPIPGGLFRFSLSCAVVLVIGLAAGMTVAYLALERRPVPDGAVRPSPRATGSPAPTATVAFVTSVSANIRSAPNADASPLGSLGRGARIVVGPPVAEVFREVVGGAAPGFVHRSVIETESDRAARLQEERRIDRRVTATGTVIEGPLNLRLGPSPLHPIFAQIPVGSWLDILQADIVQGWHRACFEGQIVYVSRENLSQLGSARGSCAPSDTR